MPNEFRIRNVKPTDLNDLYDLSKSVKFINLPNDKKMIQDKITASFDSFKKSHDELWKNWYVFILEDIKNKKAIGVSMIHAQHGTEHEPHFYLKVDHEHKFSNTINTGFTHGTLKLGLETNGHSEIGGLVLNPSFRNHPQKLGKFLSFVRFLYIAIYPGKFTEMIHSELMPPLDEKGNSPLWEAIGRRFLNMNYQEADILSRNNKEFILSLFPSENIYMTLLPIEARESIGKVGKDTIPVKSMLERIGFEYVNEVDPFDGGPHYRAKKEDIKPIKSLKQYRAEYQKNLDEAKDYIIKTDNQKEIFEAYMIKAKIKDNVLLTSEAELCGKNVWAINV